MRTILLLLYALVGLSGCNRGGADSQSESQSAGQASHVSEASRGQESNDDHTSHQPSPSSAADPGKTQPTDTEAATSTPDSHAGTSPALPGAAGEFFEKLAVLKDDVEVTGVDVSDQDANPDAETKNRTLPSGTKELSVAVKFSWRPTGETVTIEFHNHAGRVELQGGALITESNDRTGEFAVTFYRKSEAALPDGPYQTRLLIDGLPVLAINWQIGAEKTLGAANDAQPGAHQSDLK